MRIWPLDASPCAISATSSADRTDMDWEDVFALQDQDDLPWPSNPLAFKETMMEYRKELKKLAEKMLGVREEPLGLEEGHIRKAFTNDGEFEPLYGTKVSHYPPCPRPDLVDGLRTHTDASGLILLFQDDRFGGLQAQLPDGTWVDVQPHENAIFINTGDQIEVLSNGRYKSAWHRILATRDGNRRSIAAPSEGNCMRCHPRPAGNCMRCGPCGLCRFDRQTRRCMRAALHCRALMAMLKQLSAGRRRA